MPRYLCLVLVAGLLTAAGGPGAEPEKKEDAAAKDLAKLQGKWKCVAEDLNGTVRKFNDGHVIGYEKDIEISYDADGGVATKESIKLDPSKSPRQIDTTILLNVLFPNTEGQTLQGIYQLEGDELKLAYPIPPNRQRPAELKTKQGSPFVVATYKRVKP
jgi:uncharacterized protein (TIGR03067 family)